MPVRQELFPDSCPEQASCAAETQSGSGVQYGLAAGMLVDLGKVSGRFDLLFQRYQTDFMTINYGAAQIETGLSGFRIWLRAGLDI
jgi:hypothetical protein